ncbi:MAG TPA: hypothetical protein PLM79_02865 [Syntrophobacteraceae bacterium]|nr:hypothetical protein [Syntrophobacteraceae bacterium]
MVPVPVFPCVVQGPKAPCPTEDVGTMVAFCFNDRARRTEYREVTVNVSKEGGVTVSYELPGRIAAFHLNEGGRRKLAELLRKGITLCRTVRESELEMHRVLGVTGEGVKVSFYSSKEGKDTSVEVAWVFFTPDETEKRSVPAPVPAPVERQDGSKGKRVPPSKQENPQKSPEAEPAVPGQTPVMRLGALVLAKEDAEGLLNLLDRVPAAAKAVNAPRYRDDPTAD